MRWIGDGKSDPIRQYGGTIEVLYRRHVRRMVDAERCPASQLACLLQRAACTADKKPRCTQYGGAAYCTTACCSSASPTLLPELAKTKSGGTPYGASHVSWNRKDDELSAEEIVIARALGDRVARAAAALDGALELKRP